MISFSFNHYHGTIYPIATETLHWLKACTNNLPLHDGTISFVFCDDETILDINKKFLSHNFYTDVITFDLSNFEMKDTLADIYISLDRVADNSNKLKISFDNELNRVMLHGILHLCGFNDKTKKEKQLMRNMEDAFLSRFT